MKQVRDVMTRAVLGGIAGLFFASALVRVLGFGQSAMASEDVIAPKNDSPLETSCEVNPDYIPILNALRDREIEVTRKEHDLREAALSIAEARNEVVQKLAELRQAEQDLRKTVAMAREASEGDVGQLTQVYENMKPKEAAALFEKMEAAFAAGFLGRMNPKAAADILTGLNADQAYAISVHLAGRNAEIPLE